MIVRINTALRNAILDGIFNSAAGIATLDGGTAEFRTGANPASADNAASGTLLATATISADAVSAAAGGTVSKNAAAWQDLSIDNTGVCGWARFKSADGLKWIDFDVTDNAGTGAIKMSNTTLTAGDLLLITSFALTMPGG